MPLLPVPEIKEAVNARLLAAIKRPWRRWFKRLLACLIRAYMPTVDAKWAVAYPEFAHRGPLAPKLLALLDRQEQFARWIGHAAALRDCCHARGLEKSARESESDLTRIFTELNRTSPNTFETLRKLAEDLPFFERAAVLREFGHAYSHTFTEQGELYGATLATGIHQYLSVWVAIGLASQRDPRSVRELLEWTWHRDPSLNPPPTRDGRDPWEQEARRVQKICERLGLRFGGRRASPSHARRNANPATTPARLVG